MSLKDRLYYVVRHSFDQKRRAEIKRWVAMSRKKFPGIYRAIHGRFTARQLMDQIRDMIPDDFEILMIHSAYAKMVPMYSGTLSELLDELIAFCGPHRTLVMPAFVSAAPDYDLIKYYRRNRVFDVKRTASEAGALTELFRKLPGVKRSLHPTHSICALGPLAAELVATHHLGTTRMGKYTPFEIMAQKQTAIIGMGIEYYRSLAQAKSIEDILGDSFPIPTTQESVDVTMIDENNVELPYRLTVVTILQPIQALMLRSLMSPKQLMESRFHGVTLYSATAREVTEILLESTKRGITYYGNAPVNSQTADVSGCPLPVEAMAESARAKEG